MIPPLRNVLARGAAGAGLDVGRPDGFAPAHASAALPAEAPDRCSCKRSRSAPPRREAAV